MDPGEKRITGTRDEHYDLITVLYHALQGAETDEEYALDAEAAGDEQLASFFREAQDTHRHLAERAKSLLGILEVSPEPEVAPDLPPEDGLTPGAMAGGIPPEPATAEPGRATSSFDETTPTGAPPDTFGDLPPEDEIPPITTPGDVTPRPTDIEREPGVRPEEAGRPVGEVPPATDVPRTSPSATSPGTATPLGAPPEDEQRGSPQEPQPRRVRSARLAGDAEVAGTPPGSEPDVPPPHIPVASPPREDAGDEPGRATPERPAARQTEQEEENEGLLDKAKDTLKEARDKLTGQ